MATKKTTAKPAAKKTTVKEEHSVTEVYHGWNS